MKIDIVRQTPIPPPIDHAVITVSERELRIIASAVRRDNASGLRGSNVYAIHDLTDVEFEAILRKFKEIYP